MKTIKYKWCDRNSGRYWAIFPEITSVVAKTSEETQKWE